MGSEGASGDDRSARRKKTKEVLLKEALKKKVKAAGDAGEDEREESAWGDAFSRAEGKKVFDDPKKLAKAIKREKRQKSKKSERWKDIEQEQEAKKDEKQKKRTKNLKERTAKKIARKIARRK